MRKRSLELSAEIPSRAKPVKKKDEVKGSYGQGHQKDADMVGCMKPVASSELRCPTEKATPFCCLKILVHAALRQTLRTWSHIAQGQWISLGFA